MGEAETEGVRDQLLMDGQRNVGGPQQQQQQCTTCTMTAASAAAAELSFFKPAGFIQHKMRRSSDSRARNGGLAREEGRGSVGGSSKRMRRGSSARTLAAGLALTLAACSTPAYGFMVPAGAGGADPITGAAAAVAAGQHRQQQQQQQQQQQFSRGAVTAAAMATATSPSCSGCAAPTTSMLGTHGGGGGGGVIPSSRRSSWAAGGDGGFEVGGVAGGRGGVAASLRDTTRRLIAARRKRGDGTESLSMSLSARGSSNSRGGGGRSKGLGGGGSGLGGPADGASVRGGWSSPPPSSSSSVLRPSFSSEGPHRTLREGGAAGRAMGAMAAGVGGGDGAGGGRGDEPRRNWRLEAQRPDGSDRRSRRRGRRSKPGSPPEAGGGEEGVDGGGGAGEDPDAGGPLLSSSPLRNSPLRWMRRNLRAGWGGKAAGAAGAPRKWGSGNGGGRGRGRGLRRTAAGRAAPEEGQVSPLDKPHDVTGEEESDSSSGIDSFGLGMGFGHQRDGNSLFGWGGSSSWGGWATGGTEGGGGGGPDDRRMGWTNKEWRKFTAGLRGHTDDYDKIWSSWVPFKVDTSGLQEVLKTKTSDLAIKTLAKLQTMAGQEDQAEETLLKLIRDPYNLGDVSWLAKSAAETAEWRRLAVHQKRIKNKHLKDVMALEDRSLALSAEFEGTILDYSRMNVSQLTMKLLFDLAKRQNLSKRITAMFEGEKINNTENRAVLHVALRSHKDDPPIYVDDVDVIQQVHDTLDKVKDFSERVRSGELRGATGKNLVNIVAVGIGGSYLGPEFVHEAFKTQEYAGREKAEGYRLRFLSNVDPVDVRRTLYDLDPEETLVVVISKTFTTAETMLNARTARQWLWDTMGEDPKVAMKHLAACASESATERVTAFGIPKDRLFPLWDWVGGRYSVCSSVGALPLSLKYGFQQFDSFLAGARSMDRHFLHAPLEKNMPVLMGLLGVWNISFMGYKTRTILPYAEALLKFPAHIQQLAMESNGKRVTRKGDKISYDIGQVDFGEPGTNGQHSFFQLLHMGQICPAEFIGFIESQNPLHIKGEPICSHDELMANFFAQPDALAVGKPSEELEREGCRPDLIPHRTFDGNRPSLSLLVPKVNAYHLGQILALYEHRTAVEGFMWDINSFDQWGVELGKSLATDIREKMQRFRSPEQEAPSGLNPSTYRLMSRYLQQSDSLIKKGGNINHRSKVIKKDL